MRILVSTILIKSALHVTTHYGKKLTTFNCNQKYFRFSCNFISTYNLWIKLANEKFKQNTNANISNEVVQIQYFFCFLNLILIQKYKKRNVVIYSYTDSKKCMISILLLLYSVQRFLYSRKCCPEARNCLWTTCPPIFKLMIFLRICLSYLLYILFIIWNKPTA